MACSLGRRLRLVSFVAPLSLFLCFVVVKDLEHAHLTREQAQKWEGVHNVSSWKRTIVKNKEPSWTSNTTAGQVLFDEPLTEQDILINAERRRRLEERANFTRPDFASLIDRKSASVTGDVQFLLDWSIVGFGKCGSTTILEWLHQHPEVACIQEEVWSLMLGKPHKLVRRLYHGLPEGPYVRGYKCPTEIKAGWHVMRYYRDHFPATKLFIGVRHPISYWQSLYNFRTQNLESVPHPNQLIGPCLAGRKNTCTEKANFALDLMRLGKTNLINGAYVPQSSTSLQEEILGHYRRMWYNVSEALPLPNEIFFYDMHQLSDGDPKRQHQFRRDVQDLLQLSSILPPIVHYTPGKKYDNATVQDLKDAKKIRICDDEFQPVRDELMRIGRLNSKWIREVFLKLPGVRVSSPDYLDELLHGWNHDPCNSTDPKAVKVREVVRL